MLEALEIVAGVPKAAAENGRNAENRSRKGVQPQQRLALSYSLGSRFA